MGSNFYIKSVFWVLLEIFDDFYVGYNVFWWGNGLIKGLGVYREEGFVGWFLNLSYS